MELHQLPSARERGSVFSQQGNWACKVWSRPGGSWAGELRRAGFVVRQGQRATASDNMSSTGPGSIAEETSIR